ncbi:DEAD/DEAH box helicase [Streptomyces gamaensis]|uniref:RNA helicase n=1 Tax=Streptomyces gamaensis TaxID=1763542 RepID=A0ABW0YWL9_9ACTN
MTLPVALSGSDVIGQAKTGTGKTLGFGLPLLERVVVPADVEAGRARPEELTDAPQALVVVPTRELCQQVTNDLLTAGKVRNVRVQAIYGGRAYEPQVEALKKGVDVIVGTPGRLLDLAGQNKLSLARVKALVLDEADEMLDLGFLPDVERILTMLPDSRQTMLFSATMPGAVISLARRYMDRPTHIRATSPDDEGATHSTIAQHVFRAHSMDKPEMVARILQAEGRGLAMIFCRTKRTAADISEQLSRRGFAAGAVHGDLGQGAREQALRAFRNGKVDVLVCTDVAARGIDVDNVTHVINYQSPEDEKTYLHRIGRTGRAGKSGTAVTLVDWDDIPRWKLINKALGQDFDEPEETYSTSPHLYELLGIPAGTKGVLPRSERTRAGLAAEEIEDLGETGGRGRGGRGRGPQPAAEERPERTPRRRRRTRAGAPLSSPDTAVEAPGQQPSDTAGTPAKPRRRRRTRGGLAATTAPAQPAASADSEAADTTERPRRRRTRGGLATADATAEVTGSAAPAAEASEQIAAIEPSERPRRRTRGGVATPEAGEVTGSAAPAAEASEQAAPVEPSERPRRRRTRGGPAAEVAAAAESAVVSEAPVAPVSSEVPAQRRRPRAEAAVEAVETVTAEAGPKRARAAKKAAAEEIVDAVETAEAKPKRTRKTAADAVEAEAKPVRRTRTAKKAAAPAETAVEADAEAKPKRTRKTAAAKAAEAVETAEGAEAKPKRTRKTAAAKAEVAVDTADAEAKPKRTRKTAAKKAAATVEAVDGVEAKPKRTRTVKKAAAPAEAVADAEAKPKRARKTAEAAETAETAEAKPKRTRKTAAAKKAAAAEPAATA